MKEPVRGLTHLASAAAGVIGLIVLLEIGSSLAGHRISLVIYAVSLILLFSVSAAYHIVRGSPSTGFLLRRLDHSAIFIMIAGTYTPVCVIVLQGVLGTVLLVIIWSLAAAGVLLKVLFFRKVPSWISTAFYVVMGWLGLVVVVPLVQKLPPAGLAWLLGGGLLYTIGALIYARRRLVIIPRHLEYHEVWHLFVSAGALAHFILIARYIAVQ